MIARDCVDVCFLLTQFRRKAPTDDTFRMEQLALCVGVGLGGVLCREPIGRAPLTHLPARMCSLLCCTAIWTLCVSWTFLGIFVARCSAFVRLLDSLVHSCCIGTCLRACTTAASRYGLCSWFISHLDNAFALSLLVLPFLDALDKFCSKKFIRCFSKRAQKLVPRGLISPRIPRGRCTRTFSRSSTPQTRHFVTLKISPITACIHTCLWVFPLSLTILVLGVWNRGISSRTLWCWLSMPLG